MASLRATRFFIVAALYACALSTATVTLESLSTLYLPFNYTNPAKYVLGAGTSEKFDYCKKSKVAYVVGDYHVHIIDVSDPYNTTILGHYTLTDGPGTSVKVCGDYVIATVANKVEPLPGWLIVFKVYIQQTRLLEEVNRIDVGHAPDMVSVTSDCRTFIVADEGEAGKGPDGKFMDPEGSVTLVTFLDDDLSKIPRVSVLDFRKFNNRTAELVKKGVRFVYRGTKDNPNTLAHDLEPEYVAINDDDTKAYVSLQENNAMAVVDIKRREIEELYPLGSQDWSAYHMDASDKDGGINMASWPIYGMYQPDTIIYRKLDGVGYILGANEGNAKDYTLEKEGLDWTEEIRGIQLVKEIHPGVDPSLRAALTDKSKLGQLIFSSVDGKDASGKYTKLYTYGARNFGIWRASDMKMVSSSRDDLEWRHFEHMAPVFNGDCKQHDTKPTQEYDVRSDDKGPEPESIDAATIGSKTYIFVGNERMGTIVIYSINKKELLTQPPKFESIYRAGGILKTWNELFELRNAGDMDPEELRIIPKEDSPNGKHLLMLIGTYTGTFSVCEIKGIPEEQTAADVLSAGYTTTVNVLLFFLVMLLKRLL